MAGQQPACLPAAEGRRSQWVSSQDGNPPEALQGGIPGSAACAVWAAAALGSCVPQLLLHVVIAVHAALLGLPQGRASRQQR